MSHIHEKIDFTVEVFIVYKNKVLLRKHDKYGIWLSVGGHIELDEDPNETALREVKEEVGLDIKLLGELHFSKKDEKFYKELIPPVFLNRHTPGGTGSHEHVTFVYFATTNNDNIIPENDSDIYKWFTQAELEDTSLDIMEDIKFYAISALKKFQ